MPVVTGAGGAVAIDKSAAYRLEPGMDYVDLFIGSEGTLGVGAEADLGSPKGGGGGQQLLQRQRNFS